MRSSPGPKTGCSPSVPRGFPGDRPALRSSPGPKTGCSVLNGAHLGHCGPCCDPHPVRRPGAARGRDRDGRAVRVAILTRSEDRVQLGRDDRPADQRGLRSSPGPKTGCSAIRSAESRLVKRAVAILTRSEDRVQHRPVCPRFFQQAVAILTRSEDRVQRRSTAAPREPGSSCDPHPVRRPGAASGPLTGGRRSATRCDPHPVRRPGAARTGSRRCHRTPTTSPTVVAILTRSEDRVQRVLKLPDGPQRDRVAILTRSEDRVQRTDQQIPRPRPGLRSSPGPKTGCSWGTSCRRRAPPGRCDPHPVRRPGAASRRTAVQPVMPALRSSPGPKTGCSFAGGSGGASGARCDPHPVRRPGAATPPPAAAPRSRWLRSSPGPKTGCSLPGAGDRVDPGTVAILTRSEDRVQQRRCVVDVD